MLRTSVSKSVFSRFEEAFGDAFETGTHLSRYTSARVGGPAEMFVTVRNADELQTAVHLAYVQHIPYFILGGGSNILMADEGYGGLVIFNRAKGTRFRHTGASVVCTAESGVNLSSLTRKCINKGLGGLEWAINVPGTVGGAVFGNAGAHGADMSTNVRAVTLYKPGKERYVLSNEELEFSYRSSALKRAKTAVPPIVLSAEIALTPEDPAVLMGRAEGFSAHRKQTQPNGATVGSMFKNPENYYAGYLIETAGLKGLRVGGAQISEKHANFFVSDGTATAEDIRALIAEAWNTVREKFGVEMELEVELVGKWEFDE